MERNNRRRHPMLSSRITGIVSVTLVLILLDVLATVGLTAHRVTTRLGESVGFVVVVSETADSLAVDSLGRELSEAAYSRQVTFASAEDVMNRWVTWTGDSLPADLNPFLCEYDVRVNIDYASADSLDLITAQIVQDKRVEGVNMQEDVASSVNATLNIISTVLLLLLVVLMIISLVLINNTLRLMVYARRFTIHTMRLVGATAGYIRRPFVMGGFTSGLISALASAAVYALVMWYFYANYPAIQEMVGIVDAAIIGGSVMLFGVLLCVVASLAAANKYIRLEYDKMFK